MDRKALRDPKNGSGSYQDRKRARREIEGSTIKFPAPWWYQTGFRNCVPQVKCEPGRERLLPEVSITAKVKFK